ncbi:MAG: sodium-dependent transporter [Clostridiales bacterium]|nr:sodium-dependent transporter [Clostridiales bacterium]MDY2730419.1 sodium-dependent transporter [Clostridium sp.]NLK24893.1 sodium-dependent transporter [Clostridiales bacterium]
MNEKNTSFSSKIGFVLAAAGSAVGLGNIWRFPYLAAKYGGGIFLLIYVVLALTFGFTLMITELALGRKTGKSVIGAFSTINKKYSFIGYIAALVPIIILPYYSVIGGWVFKYFSMYLLGNGHAAVSDNYFANFTAQTYEPLFWLCLFIIPTTIVVMMGVEKGIEKASKFLMPVLVVLSVFIAIYTITRPGALEGVKYYIIPDFSKLSINSVFAALGQLFYSMSLAMGIMITYGSYMKRDEDLNSSVKQIEVFDTSVAFIAGLIIIPSVFIFSGGDESMLSSGPGLMFITLPKVFDSMKFGNVIGFTFFLLVLFAAITSAISIMETIVSLIMEKTKLSRIKTCLIVLFVAVIIAIPSSFGFGVWSNIKIIGMDFLDFFDFISNSVIMPIVALLTCFYVSIVIKPDGIVDEVKLGGYSFSREKLYRVMIKYIAPICLIVILITSVLNTFGLINL